MHVLYSPDLLSLSQQTESFDRYMEPRVQQLESAVASGTTPDDVPAFRAYVDVCRWPFRRLEYALVLDVLLGALADGTRMLDAGCGVTPLAHIFSDRGVTTYGCDFDASAIEALRRLPADALYGSHVEYSTEDITALTYSDAFFDAVACVSVLEHIPAPDDQRAIGELLRVLKPEEHWS